MRHGGQVGHQLLVPAAVESPHALLHQGVGRVQREVAGRGPDHRPSAVVRRHWQLPGVSHGGNLARLAQAAAPAQVQHHHTGHAGLQVVLEGPFVAQGFAGADQGFAIARVLLEQVQAVHADRVFMPKGVEGLEGTCDLLRHRQAPQAVELDHDVHAVANRRADLAKRLQRQVQVGIADVLAVAALGRWVKRPDFHGRDAFTQQGLGHLVGPVQKSLQVFVRPLVLTQAPVGGTLVHRIAYIAVAGAGVVDADVIAAFATQGSVQRHVGRLAKNVP